MVGKLLKPGEAHNSYSDEDEEPNTSTSTPSDAKEGDGEEAAEKVEKKEIVEPVEKPEETGDGPKEEAKPKEEWPLSTPFDHSVDCDDDKSNFHKFCEMFSL